MTHEAAVDGGLRALGLAPRPVWQEAVDGDPHAQAFHGPDWVDAVCATSSHENATRLYETADGRRLVLPMIRRRYVGGALSLQGSFPVGFGIGGVVSRDPVRPEDLAAVYADLRAERGVLRTFIRPVARAGSLWAAADLPGVKSVPRLSHVLDLEGGFDTVWTKRFTGTARTAVRKAEKSGVVVERDTTGALLPEYYRLVEDSVRRWAERQHEPLLLSRLRTRRFDSPERFQAMAAALPTRFNLYLARHDGQAVAGIVVYGGTGAHYTRGAMIKELASPVRANYLLHRVAIEDACRAGSTHYDLGESGASRDLAQFKTRFGARPLPYSEYVIERLPLTELDRSLRSAVKRVIRFKEVGPVTAAPEPAAASPGEAA